MTIETRDPHRHFAAFLELGYGFDVALNVTNQLYFRWFAEDLGNVELAAVIKRAFPDVLTCQNVVNVLQRKTEVNEMCHEEIEFIAQHFEEDDLCASVLKNLAVDQISEIFKSSKFRISNEDWFFATLSKHWESDSRFLSLSEFVQFEYLSASRFRAFVSNLIEILPMLNQSIWKRIAPRLNISEPTLFVSFTVKTVKHESLTMTMALDHTVLDLKHALSRRTGLAAVDHQLMIDNNEMKDDCLLGDYGVKGGSVICMKIRRLEFSQLFVLADGKLMTIVVSIAETVKVLKDILRQKTGVPVNDQHLIYAGKALRDNFQLRDFGIQANSTLELLHCWKKDDKPCESSVVAPPP
jgi:ubiquitin C